MSPSPAFVPGFLIHSSGHCIQQFLNGAELLFYLRVQSWVVGRCWEVDDVKWLENLLSETRNSGVPSLLVQLSVNATITSSWVLPLMAMAITNYEKLSANPRMYLNPSFVSASGPARSRLTICATFPFSRVQKQCSTLTSFCIFCFCTQLAVGTFHQSLL